MSAREPSWQSVNESATRSRPVSLTPAEIGSDPVHEADRPLPAKGWVRMIEAPIFIEDGYVVAWTRRAVQIEFQLRDGRTLRAWVWRGAVEPR